ncbi:MAG: 7-beta-(4-carbaxybutanamido)cephalosporanic acid acylase [Candidatus Hydrogenedentota bacterium]
MRKWILVPVAACLIGGGLFWACQTRVNTSLYIDQGMQYNVRVLRDTWGVPHIYGKTDADVAYGLGFAHSEDDYATIQEALLMTRGRLATLKGKESAPVDFLVNLLRVQETVNAKYESDISPEVRRVCEAYAAGVNHYAALHPSEVHRGVLPYTGQDVVAGFYFKSPFFFGLERRVQELMGKERKRPVSQKRTAQSTNPVPGAEDWLTEGVPIGSNMFAVGPTRSSDGGTYLNINSHQPWDGPVAWYEAHLVSDEGWDIVGGTFPGSPVILHGHNRHLGWAHTVNSPDLVDVYVLDVNPDNSNQYQFDGEWRDFEIGTARLKVKLWGPFSWTVKREVLWCVYGPAVRTEHGVYAIRHAAMDDIRQVEQWFRMDKATTMKEWMDAMRMQAIASFNCGYADKDGNILYLYNAKLPLRSELYDWNEYLPGNTSETLWTEFLPFDRLPKVVNPPSGFIQNCNSSPFQTTTGEGNPLESEFSATFGIETLMTNRATRAMELFGADASITPEEFIAYKYDMRYSDQSAVATAIQELSSAPAPDDPLVRESIEVIRQWNLQTDIDNPSAAIAMLALQPDSDGGIKAKSLEQMHANMAKYAPVLKATHGRLDVPYGSFNRIARGSQNLPIGGGADTLHAVYSLHMVDGELLSIEDGIVEGKGGDSYVLLAFWDKDGRVTSKTIHQYGSATMHPESPHYADQTPLFARRELRDVWISESDIRAHLEREYRPGE